jgi:hypothetical protein
MCAVICWLELFLAITTLLFEVMVTLGVKYYMMLHRHYPDVSVEVADDDEFEDEDSKTDLTFGGDEEKYEEMKEEEKGDEEEFESEEEDDHDGEQDEDEKEDDEEYDGEGGDDHEFDYEDHDEDEDENEDVNEDEADDEYENDTKDDDEAIWKEYEGIVQAEHKLMIGQMYAGPSMHRSIVPKVTAVGHQMAAIDTQKLS